MDYVRKTAIDMLLPMTDVTTLLIAQCQSELEPHTRFTLPSPEAFDFVTNKWTLLKQAQTLGIPIPETRFVREPDELSDVLTDVSYPAVVKPYRSWILASGGNRLIPTRVHLAVSEAELRRLYRENEYLRYPSLIQERIVGPGQGVFLLFDHGKLLTAFCHRRLRELPPSGGISVFRESIPLEPHLLEHARQMLEPLAWHGVAMMEYKRDRRTGQAVLMEVNGRFWGSLQLAIDAGVDFPFLLYQLTMNGHVETPPDYRIGIKSRWLMGDVHHMILRLFEAESDLQLPPGFPSRAKTVLHFLRFFEPGLRYEVLSVADPGPSLFEVTSTVRRLLVRSRTVHA